MSCRSLALACLLPLAAGPALATAQSLTPAQRQALQAVARACRSDAARLCPGVQPGGGRILACFADHRDAVSPPCRDALAAARPDFPAGN